MTAAGWVVPIDKLIDTEQIRVRDCNVYFYVGKDNEKFEPCQNVVKHVT